MNIQVLRDMDKPLWRRLKAKCALEGITIPAGLLRAVTAWVSGKEKGG